MLCPVCELIQCDSTPCVSCPDYDADNCVDMACECGVKELTNFILVLRAENMELIAKNAELQVELDDKIGYGDFFEDDELSKDIEIYG